MGSFNCGIVPDAAELLQTLDVRELELAYEKNLRETDLICDRERARQLRVCILLLEDENLDLHAQLAQNHDRIDDLGRYSDQILAELDVVERRFDFVQSDLRLKSRQVETLNAELGSMSSVSMDSTKLLTEKLSLARELSVLRPEIDYLRSQAALHQSLLAEKLSLEQQLSTLQVEMETEKRATQRILAKESKLQAEDAKLESRIDFLQAELAKERRERQKAEREAQKESVEWESTKTILESRLDAFRNKLKTTKDQLKEAQLEQQIIPKLSAGAVGGTSKEIAKISRKRSAAELDTDAMIGTPGVLPAAKRSKRGSTMPGHKSTFSITPFLNRTVSVAPESPAKQHDTDENADETELHDVQLKKPGNRREPSPKQSNISELTKLAKQSVRGQKPEILGITKVGKTNSRAPTLPKIKTMSFLEQVAEEDKDETAAAAVIPSKSSTTINEVDDKLNDGFQMKRKKRKLLGSSLGRTLFDEDDGEAHKGSKRGMKGFVTLGKVNFVGHASGLGESGGTFSPLKDKRTPFM